MMIVRRANGAPNRSLQPAASSIHQIALSAAPRLRVKSRLGVPVLTRSQEPHNFPAATDARETPMIVLVTTALDSRRRPASF
jgi:hypothetical protein